MPTYVRRSHPEGLLPSAVQQPASGCRRICKNSGSRVKLTEPAIAELKQPSLTTNDRQNARAALRRLSAEALELDVCPESKDVVRDAEADRKGRACSQRPGAVSPERSVPWIRNTIPMLNSMTTDNPTNTMTTSISPILIGSGPTTRYPGSCLRIAWMT